MTAPNQQQAVPAAGQQQPAQGQPLQGQGDQGQQQGQQVQQGQVQQQPFPGQQGQQQGQTAPNPWAGLLDVVPPVQGQPGQQFQGQQFGQQGFPGAQQGWPAQQTGGGQFDQQAMADLIGRAVQSAVDRRVNQLTNPQWQQAHGQPGSTHTGHPGGNYPSPQTMNQPQSPLNLPYQAPVGPSEADMREARMAAREYLGDRITFGSEAERAMAVDLTAALIPTQLLMGMTPNQAAQNVAQTVADRVGSLRRTYEDQAVRALRSRGLLVDTPQGPAAMAGSVGLPQGGMPVGTAQQQQQAAKAAKLATWAQEENAQRGWKTQTATA